jgi:hypothetical protein
MTCPLFAPVNAIAKLTTGRNLSGYVSGHTPILTLNGDPDTYWQPNSFGTTSLYVDLQNSIAVDAVALWLYDYNNTYASPKAVKIYASADDVTYVQYANYVFIDLRTNQNEPTIVVELDTPVSARYWKIEFVNFTSTYPRISCVWVLTDYSLTHNYQMPEQIESLHFVRESQTQSNTNSYEQTGVGKQRYFNRQFILVNDDDYNNLLTAHNASRGGVLPIFMRLYGEFGAYLPLLFTSPLGVSKQEHQFYQITMRLVELGFKRTQATGASLLDFGVWGITC